MTLAAEKQEAAAEEAAAEEAPPKEEAKEKEEAEAAEGESTEAVPEEEEQAKEDPEEVALKAEIEKAEAAVKTARQNLGNAQNKLADGGKPGYLRIAAKVQDYKRRVQDGKKSDKDKALIEVTSSFVDVLEELRKGPNAVPATDDTEESLHSNFQALYTSMNDVFVKFGLETFHAVAGEPFSESLHEKSAGPEAEAAIEAAVDPKPGTVISEVSPGLRIKGEVIRRAAVVAAPEPEKAAEAPEAEASEAEASEAEAAPEA